MGRCRKQGQGQLACRKRLSGNNPTRQGQLLIIETQGIADGLCNGLLTGGACQKFTAGVLGLFEIDNLREIRISIGEGDGIGQRKQRNRSGGRDVRTRNRCLDTHRSIGRNGSRNRSRESRGRNRESRRRIQRPIHGRSSALRSGPHGKTKRNIRLLRLGNGKIQGHRWIVGQRQSCVGCLGGNHSERHGHNAALGIRRRDSRQQQTIGAGQRQGQPIGKPPHGKLKGSWIHQDLLFVRNSVIDRGQESIIDSTESTDVGVLNLGILNRECNRLGKQPSQRALDVVRLDSWIDSGCGRSSRNGHHLSHQVGRQSGRQDG